MSILNCDDSNDDGDDDDDYEREASNVVEVSAVIMETMISVKGMVVFMMIMWYGSVHDNHMVW